MIEGNCYLPRLGSYLLRTGFKQTQSFQVTNWDQHFSNWWLWTLDRSVPAFKLQLLSCWQRFLPLDWNDSCFRTRFWVWQALPPCDRPWLLLVLKLSFDQSVSSQTSWLLPFYFPFLSLLFAWKPSTCLSFDLLLATNTISWREGQLGDKCLSKRRTRWRRSCKTQLTWQN